MATDKFCSILNYQSSSDTTAMMRMQEISGTTFKADEPVTVKNVFTVDGVPGPDTLNLHAIATTFIA